MNTRVLDRELCYDGSQLRAHWILRTTGIAGDACVAFRGPCQLPRAEIADLADVDGPGIAGDDMLHFVAERFDDGRLDVAVLRQRLLVAIAGEVLRARADAAAAARIRRDGDDLWVGDGKLSISVATRSAVSTLIHFAVNVTNDGTPVRTACLRDLGVDADAFAGEVLDRLRAEEASMELARVKVRPRGEAGQA